MYCQIIDVIHPGKIAINKVNWKAKNDYEFISNLKILQSAFDKIAVFCSTVSPFSMNFWAIDDFLMTRKGLSDSRGILFKKLGAIEEGLGKFDDSTINALFAKIVRADA